MLSLFAHITAEACEQQPRNLALPSLSDLDDHRREQPWVELDCFKDCENEHGVGRAHPIVRARVPTRALIRSDNDFISNSIRQSLRYQPAICIAIAVGDGLSGIVASSTCHSPGLMFD